MKRVSCSLMQVCFLLFLIGFFVSGVAISSKAASDSPSDIIYKFVDGVNHADIESIAELLSDEANMFLPFTPRRAENKKEIIDVFGAALARVRSRGEGPEYFDFEIVDLKVQTPAPNVAIATWHFDRKSFARRTAVLVKENSSWKIISFHASNLELSED